MVYKNLLLSAAFSLSVVAEYKDYLIVFGNSFSDIGNRNDFKYTVPWWNNRYSSGPVWDEYLASYNNYTLVNFAVGGAASNNTFLQSLVGVNVIYPSLLDQVSMYTETFKGLYTNNDLKNDVVAVEIGTNDILNSHDFIVNNTVNMQVFTDGVVLNTIAGINNLIEFGYRKILVANVPDIARMPNYVGSSQADLDVINDFVVQINTKLAGNLTYLQETSQNNIDYIRIVPFYETLDVLHDQTVSQAMKTTYLTESCYNIFNNGTYSACTDPDDYTYIDGVHITTRAHSLLAAVFAQIISNPTFKVTKESLISLISQYNVDQVTIKNNYLFSGSFIGSEGVEIIEYNIKNATSNAQSIAANKNSYSGSLTSSSFAPFATSSIISATPTSSYSSGPNHPVASRCRKH
ncbi:Thermolabile hemolysin [Smittium mucronatum]|uniref:Thermolabile hemolysin n=1 Tax=Smittium mucronatum TaxID=133383 RepID=A0A1R0GWX1_9FUNG|nr:Thermolabile hemolysin [Smittium mucronatum]